MVRNNIGDDWAICTNNSLHKGGRIALLWDPSAYNIDILDVQVQSIHIKVVDKIRRKNLWTTFVYGLNKAVERIPLWDSLRFYHNMINGPWIVAGDFNSVMAANERIRGARIINADIIPMIQSIQDCQLSDISAQEAFFTWNNKHEYGSKVYSRLDRVLINAKWMDIFSESYDHFLPEGMFDHCLEEARHNKVSSFNYYNMWSLAPNYNDIVLSGWQQKVQGTLMFRVVQKLKGLKAGLKQLNREHFADIENLSHVVELSLNHFQQMLIDDPLNEDLCHSERDCARNIEELVKARDQYLRQNAKGDWMQHGDDNTAYFHASIKNRRAKNRIYQVKYLHNQLCSTPETIQKAFEDYYKMMLGSSKEVKPLNKRIVKIGKCFNSRALLSLDCSWPDGYSSQFFKDNGSIEGVDVISAIQSVFQSGKVLNQCNTTIITLIPKVPISENNMQFRPIAYCNTLYKCLSNVICARLGKVLPNIIDPSQSAFIKVRDIVGNILICQDLIRLYKRKSCSPRILMKLDLQKAYDSVEWNIVEDMLRATGFPKQFT
ncbi:uncharacterized protein LOC141595294 [Silene latifolia]|uniref:uncharacterized protein LOC141595294 n=1 Tax=Silene latifolia TaxID=37657 RepID=UPI003D76DB04